jgi:hypothetical protein
LDLLWWNSINVRDPPYQIRLSSKAQALLNIPTVFNDGRKVFMGAPPSVGEIGAVAKVPLQHGRGIETTLSHTEQRV